MYCAIGTQEHEDRSQEADHKRRPLGRQFTQVQPEVKDLMRVLMLPKNQQRQQNGEVSNYVQDQYETLELW